MGNLAIDIRYGLRGLRRSLAFAAAAILTFALGIGIATAMFSVVDAVLIEPLPFRHSAELVRLVTTTQETASGRPWTGSVSVSELMLLRARSLTLSGVGAYANVFRTLTGAASTARLEGWRVEPELLEVLGTPALLGRVFRPGKNDVVLLSQGTWRRGRVCHSRTAGHPDRSRGRAARGVGKTRRVSFTFCVSGDLR